MRNNPLHVRLGNQLRVGRRAAHLSQGDLAARVGCSLVSVRLAENGGGGSALFGELAAALGLELHGRMMPPSENLGAGLAALRNRRGLGRRTLSELTGVSVPTLTAMERGENVHFVKFVTAAVILGAGLTLTPKGTAKTYWEGAAVSSGHQGWTTPPELLAKLYDAVGGPFDLDPCSPSADRRSAPVMAKVHFAEADNGLALDWFGAVFINPPYGRGIGKWVSKCRQEVACNRARFTIALLPARSDTNWWHHDIAGKADTFMLKGRLAFGGSGGQSAPFASALACWGLDQELCHRMRKAFPDAWFVPAVAHEQEAA
jgi:transcriptional regulator with XRE-family HTH domain